MPDRLPRRLFRNERIDRMRDQLIEPPEWALREALHASPYECARGFYVGGWSGLAGELPKKIFISLPDDKFFYPDTTAIADWAARLASAFRWIRLGEIQVETDLATRGRLSVPEPSGLPLNIAALRRLETDILIALDHFEGLEIPVVIKLFKDATRETCINVFAGPYTRYTKFTLDTGVGNAAAKRWQDAALVWTPSCWKILITAMLPHAFSAHERLAIAAEAKDLASQP